MIIVFPTTKYEGLGAKRGAHFGKANYYTVIHVEEGIVKDVVIHKNPGHVTGACSDAVTNIQSLGTDVLIVGGIGGEPLKKFLAIGIDVYFDDKNEILEDSLRAFLAGKVSKIDPNHTCSHK